MSGSRPNKTTSTLWTSLIQYYRSCLDLERELTLYAPTDQNARVLLRDIDEHLITKKAITTVLTDPKHTQPVLTYLNRRGRGIGGTFIYGFPLARVGDRLYPLCYTEVRLEPGAAPQTVMLSRGVSELLLNRYFLHFEAGLTDPEITALQRALLSPKSKGPAAVLDQFLLEVDLVYDAVLFGSEATPPSRGPGRELQLMEQLRKERLPDAIRIFAGEQRMPSLEPTHDFLTILPADHAQLAVLQKRKAPFLVVAGPTGSGKSQTAANLIASALTERQKALYISRDGQVPAALRSCFPGILEIGDQEAWAESLVRAQQVIGEMRQPADEGADRSALLAESKRLAAELERLDAAAAEHHRLTGLLPELESIEGTVAQTLADHPDWLWMERLAQQVTPANANQFGPEQFLALRRLRVQALGWEQKGGSLGGRMREKRRATQITTALRQAEVPDFCHPDGDLVTQIAGLSRLEQAFPMLLARARRIHAQGLVAGKKSPEDAANQALEARQAKINVDQQLLRIAWQALAARMQAKCDHLEETITQELESLDKGGAPRTALRRQRFTDLMEAFPVIVSPTLTVAGMIPNEPELFDLLIVDDASQVDLPSFMPVLYRAKRVIILGDEHGPRKPTCLGTDEDSRLLGKVADWNLAPFAYTEMSPLHRALAMLGPMHTVRLTQQYSTAPALVDWWSQHFYGGAIRPARGGAAPGEFHLADVADGQTIYPAPGAISQAQNALEAREVARQVTLLIERGITDLVVLTPFRGQALLLAKLLQRLGEVQPDPALAAAIGQVPVLTPETINHQRFAVAVISLVASTGATAKTLEWLDQSEGLILQMLHAARDGAVIIGHRERLASGGPLLASLVARTGAADPEAGGSSSLSHRLRPEVLGFTAAERSGLDRWLSLPGLDPETWSEPEQELYRHLTSLIRGRPVLIAPRLPLFTVVTPGLVRTISPEQKTAAANAHLLFTLVEARSGRPIVAVDFEIDAPAPTDLICHQAGLPLTRLRPGQWEALEGIVTLLPTPS